MGSVLVLDDRQDDRDLLATVLGHVGHRVLEASTADRALHLARAQHPDVIITDILMPTMDGYEFVRELRADPSVGETPVIFCTANYIEEEVQELAAACGVSRFLPKPCEPETILSVVGDVVSAPAPISSGRESSNEDFSREHLRVLNDKLLQKVNELEETNQKLRHSTDALRASEGRLQAIIDNTEAVIVVKAADDFRYLLANNAVAPVLGVDPRQIIGMRDEDVLPPALFKQVRANDRRVVETGQPTRDELLVPTAEGLRAFISLSFPLPRPDGRAYAVGGISTDITENKRVEQELRGMSADLQRSNADLEQFAYAASHDLSEPLRAMSGMVQLLAKRYGDRLDADGSMYIERAVEASKRMQSLINDLLAYSRVGHEEMDDEPVDCAALVQRTVDELRQAFEKAHATITVGPLPTVRGDATQLRQVFQNLIANALKFRGDAAPRIHVDAEREAAAWRLSVTDNGIGIEPRHEQRVFEVFKRLHGRDSYPGSGIGLAVCKRIIERHGGKIWVEPSDEGGSRFRFTIPDRARER